MSEPRGTTADRAVLQVELERGRDAYGALVDMRLGPEADRALDAIHDALWAVETRTDHAVRGEWVWPDGPPPLWQPA